jgi:hypothetical protein
VNGLSNGDTSFDLLADACLVLVALVEVSLLGEGSTHACVTGFRLRPLCHQPIASTSILSLRSLRSVDEFGDLTEYPGVQSSLSAFGRNR